MGFLNNNSIDTEKINNLNKINTDRLEPSGFSFEQTLTQNLSIYINMSFDDNTRTFFISPKKDCYSFYSKGIKFTKTEEEIIIIENISGKHYIYFDNNGSLKSTMTSEFFFLNGYIAISYIYWNSEEQKSIDVELECHGCVMDWADHLYNHENSNMKYINGLIIGNYTLIGDGSQNSDAQISISNGQIDDEDIRFFITHASTPIDFGEQILSPVSYIPILYKNGINGYWKKDSATQFSVKQGINRIQYNKNTEGIWSTEDISENDKFMAIWIVSSNCKNPIFSILGQREDSTLENAIKNNIFTNLDFNEIPFSEIKPLWRLIFQTNSEYLNIPKCKLVNIESLLNIQFLSISSITTLDHNTLTGRTSLNSHPASAINYDNMLSGLNSNNVKEVIDELEEKKVNKTTTINEYELNDNIIITKGDIGLDNCDNTSDLNKPISISTQIALNSKESILTKGNLTENISSILTITNGNNAVIGNGINIQVKKSDSITSGYLSSNDWNTFNNKEPAILKNTSFNQNFETNINNIKMDGNISLGILNNIPRSDHIHPSDINKQNVITGAATTITTNNLTVNKVVISDSNGKISTSDVDDTELVNGSIALNALNSFGFLNGFPSKNYIVDIESHTITTSDITRTVTVSPTNTSYTVIWNGIEKIISSILSTQIYDFEGPYAILYNGDTGQLRSLPFLFVPPPYTKNLFLFMAYDLYICVVYWDATNKKFIYVGNQETTVGSNIKIRNWLSTAVGTFYGEGMNLVNFTIGDGSLNSHAQFGIESGISILDGTIITQSSVSYLTGLPIYYQIGDLSGTGAGIGQFRRIDNHGFSVYNIPGGRLCYNNYNTLTNVWEILQVPNNNFVLYHIYATSSIENIKYISLMGQKSYTSISEARNGANNETNQLEISLIDLKNFARVGTVIFKTADSYVNSVKAKIVQTDTGENFVDFRGALD